jgi:hypothetical protein
MQKNLELGQKSSSFAPSYMRRVWRRPLCALDAPAVPRNLSSVCERERNISSGCSTMKSVGDTVESHCWAEPISVLSLWIGVAVGRSSMSDQATLLDGRASYTLVIRTGKHDPVYRMGGCARRNHVMFWANFREWQGRKGKEYDTWAPPW